MSADQAALYESEPALDDAASGVEEAKAAIRLMLRSAPCRFGSPNELQRAVPQGDWTPTLVSLAFWAMVHAGELAVDGDRSIRILTLAE